MNKKKLSFAILLFMAIGLFGQKKIVQKGVVLEINSGKQTVSGVQLLFSNALPAVSDNLGAFELNFYNMDYGDLIPVQSVQKPGYEVVNYQDLRLARLSNRELVVFLCPEGVLDSMKLVYYNISIETILQEYEKKIAALEKKLLGRELSQEKFLQEIAEMDAKKSKMAEYAKELADRFAHTNFDDVSDLYKEAFDLFMEGEIDSAIMVLEKEDIVSRSMSRISERDNINNQLAYIEAWRNESDSIKEKDIEAATIAIDSYTQLCKYSKVDSIYRYLLQLDSTNLDINIAYAIFLLEYDTYPKAKDYYLNIPGKENLPDSVQQLFIKP